MHDAGGSGTDVIGSVPCFMSEHEVNRNPIAKGGFTGFFCKEEMKWQFSKEPVLQS